jgi:hypothetical protein
MLRAMVRSVNVEICEHRYRQATPTNAETNAEVNAESCDVM